MALVYDEGTVLWEDWPAALSPVHGVRQEEVVIADLKQIPLGATLFHVILISAVGPFLSSSWQLYCRVRVSLQQGLKIELRADN